MQQNVETATPMHSPQDPATGAGAEATTQRPAPLAIVTTVIGHDQITSTAQLVMGGFVQTVQRTWHRCGRGSWRSTDPDFIAAENRLGIELAEYMALLDFPSRVADMLPRHPAPVLGEAFRAAMAAVREGCRG